MFITSLLDFIFFCEISHFLCFSYFLMGDIPPPNNSHNISPASSGIQGRAMSENQQYHRSVNENLTEIHEIPPNVDVIQYLRDQAQSRRITLTVLSGSGSVSEVLLRISGSERPLGLQEFMTITSFSGTCLFSAEGPSPVDSFVAGVARLSSQIVGGSAYKIVTAGPVTLIVMITQI